MSCYYIIYKGGAKIMLPVSSRSQYLEARNDKNHLSYLAAARQGNKLAKQKLVQFCYSCYPSADGKLKGAKMPSSTLGVDIDYDKNDEYYDEKMEKTPSIILEHADKIGLLMMERSVNKGYHIVVKRKDGMSQIENLDWLSKELGIAYDEGAKDVTRVFFATSSDEKDLLYLSDELFNDSLPIDSEEYKNLITLNAQNQKQDEKKEPEKNNRRTVEFNASATYNGYRISDIINGYLELYNNGQEPCEGNRNVMTFSLAKALRCICNYDEDILKSWIPQYDGITYIEWEQCIRNANNAQRGGMSYKLENVFKLLDSKKPVDESNPDFLKTSRPPELPEKLPYPLNILSKNVLDYYKPAVCEAVFVPMSVHMQDVQFRYWDNTTHEPTLMNILVAPMSVGKSSIRKPCNMLVEDLVKSDRLSRERENEWKVKNAGKNTKHTPRPSDICIQILIDNLTDAVFNQRVVDAANNGNKYLYSFFDELDTLKQLTSANRQDQVSIIIRKAFDNAMHGQERIGAESVTGMANLRFNFNACTTFPNLRRFFARGINDGTITRLSLSTIDVPLDAKRPVFGSYDEEYRNCIDKVCDKLKKCLGEIDCAKANQLALELLDESDELASLYDSKAYQVLSYRATVIAWIKGMILYILNDYKWRKEIENYVRWSLRYDLFCKMKAFGNQLEAEMNEEDAATSKTQVNNLLNLLPNKFSLEDVRVLRKANGEVVRDPINLLRKWKERGFVKYDDIKGEIRKI